MEDYCKGKRKLIDFSRQQINTQFKKNGEWLLGNGLKIELGDWDLQTGDVKSGVWASRDDTLAGSRMDLVD